MAGPSISPGTPTGFASTFRSAVKFAMQMGSPNATEDKVTFFWRPNKEYSHEDIIDNPYDWTNTPTTDVEIAPVQVDCAVEFGRVAGNVTVGNAVGDFDSTRATLTLLDVDYDLVRGAHLCTIGGDLYVLEYAQPLALFVVDVWQIHCVAIDES